MRGLLILGVVLILAGIAGLVVDYIPIHHQEQVAKIGPLTATADKETDVVIPPYAGVIVIVVGAALVFAARGRGRV
jgi:hypothetical protein